MHPDEAGRTDFDLVIDGVGYEATRALPRRLHVPAGLSAYRPRQYDRRRRC